MSEHSKGPWEFDGDNFIWANDPDKCANIGQVRGWGYLTGKGHGALGLDSEEAIKIQEANGYMMAAAPELLEALIEMRVALEDPSALSTLQLITIVAKADGAIAKARGTQCQ